jgi:circadian clock protein KaiB
MFGRPPNDAVENGFASMELKKSKPHSAALRLRLYIAGSSPRSLRALQNLKRICEGELCGRYKLEVIDIYRQPRRATEDQIVAIPTLVRETSGLLRRMIGDLSETAVLREALGI